jgi:hypothetical protein
MQKSVLKQQDVTRIQSQACRILPGHGTGVQGRAVNDDVIVDEDNIFWRVMSVLGNALGGILLLYGLFLLPHIVSKLFD